MTGVLLTNPKFATNVGGALRACAAFGVDELWWTGRRVLSPDESKAVKRYARLPREVRMQSYRETVAFTHFERPETAFEAANKQGLVPVAVEYKDDYESLVYFEHPTSALYVLGPEDGSMTYTKFCHRFLYIPTQHCLNLAATVNVILYDRMAKDVRT